MQLIVALFLVMLGLLAEFAPAMAADDVPVQGPMLRIEAGMHTGVVMRVDLSADGKLMVTGSSDKTIRLWSLPDGKLLRTLRVPISPDNGGKVNAVAISPDGSLIAAGGWDAYPTANYVHIFDSATGQLIRRLGPLGPSIGELAFSADGSRLAVGLMSRGGVKVWTAPFDGEPLADERYVPEGQGAVYALSFDAKNRLVTTSEDFNIRLYDDQLHLIAKVKAPGDAEPKGIAFSPDGMMVAVGHYTTSKVDILDGKTLDLLYAADTEKANNGSLAAIAWSSDGNTLYAGGTFDIDGTSPILAWGDRGRGAMQVLPGPLNTILDLTPVPGGGVAFAAADPAFGIVEPDGSLMPLQNGQEGYHGPITADMRTKRGGHFWSAPDATGVWFGLKLGSEQPWRFDVKRLAFEAMAERPADYIEPNIDRLPIESWINDFPTLNAQVLALETYERARSLAIAPDGQSFVLGAEWGLYRFDAKGQKMWRVQVPGTTWGVNLSADGRFIVAAFGDGTIRWFRASDGTELLAFFIHVPDKTWIAWTPSGYYAASPGGEDLIGWHVNGKSWDDTPDFFPASRFRQRFYRPDIVQLVLETGDEANAIAQANTAADRRTEEGSIDSLLPPVIEVIADPRGVAVADNELVLKYRLRSPSGRPITRVEARIDGQLSQARSFTPAESDYPVDQDLTIDIPIPSRNSTISLIAFSDDQASVPSSVPIKWTGNSTQGPKPKLFALLVGVSDYDDDQLKLRYAAKDAADLEAALKEQEGRYFDSVNTVLLLDHRASENKIEVELSRLRKKASPTDYVLVFMAGHGVTDAQGGFHFLPADASLEEDELAATSLSGIVIRESLRTIQAKVLLFMDACHAGNGIEGGGQGRADMTGFANDLSQDSNGIVMFASSTGRQVSFEDSRWQNGAFTDALIATLKDPEAYGKDGLLSTSELDEQLSERVATLTENRQSAVMTKPNAIPRFFLASVH
ncbi:MAG: caspase family protein [Hyphomicrobiales bacterium]